MKRRWEKARAENSKHDDSSAVQEIEKSLSDMDTYLLSIYMNDDASIYTKATDSTSFSSASSVTSTYSTRRRHRGAYDNRRRAVTFPKEQREGSTWLDSMRESSQNFFVDAQGGWTASRGWQMQPARKTWDSHPNSGWWNDTDNIFDAVKEERLEI
jgi:hypothetical protein